MMPALTSLEPRLQPEPPAPGAGLMAPRLQRPAPRGGGPVGLRSTAVSLLLHGLLMLLILFGLPDWLLHRPAAPPPTIEVALVLPPPPPPPAPPKPIVKPPEPPPTAPLSSDAQSQGPTRPSPADKAEAAPAAPEPGAPAAPPRKTETPVAIPSTKPAPAEPQRAPTPPPPRSTLTEASRAAAAASPTRQPAPETQTAMSAPPPEPAPRARGKAPAEPGTGKAAQTGFGVAVADLPGGIDPAVYDPYLASVRDKIMTKRELLRTYQWSHEYVVISLVLDDAGRLQKFDTVQTSGSYTFVYTVKNMIALAPAFGAPPPALSGKRLFFYLALPETQAEWEEMMATGKPPGEAG